MLYKAALTEASMTDGLGEECDTPPAVAPHPYTLALGVLSIQKVGILDTRLSIKYIQCVYMQCSLCTIVRPYAHNST